MMRRPCLLAGILLFLLSPVRAETPVVDLVADPAEVRLTGPVATWSLLVHGKTAGGDHTDLTHAAHYRSENPAVATVSERGVVRAVGDGSTAVRVEAAGKTAAVAVRVEGTKVPRRFNFENDVVPLFGKFGCNASGCHGKAEGQNGFKLSVFGSDPAADHAALLKESRGRRIFPGAPEASLLLAKASGHVPHGGGVRIPEGSDAYETLRGWIAAGTPFGLPTDPTVTAIRVEPGERVLAMKATQQLRVVATWSDGRTADVTAHARFQSNSDAVATVSGDGLVTAGDVPGEAAVMAAYRDEVTVFRILVPRAERIETYPELLGNNFIDGIVYAKLRKLSVLPSELADDAEYLRRVYLDVIGTLPTADEARRFLADRSPAKRQRLVEELLARPAFADFWALKWADVLRADRQTLGHKRAYAYYRWIRDAVAENKPLDRFAREILTAEGPLAEVAPTNFYRVVAKPGEQASALSQVFLGVRIACAECHHHPFDRWSQGDYHGMLAFFTPLGVRKVGPVDALTASGDPVTRHPRTAETIHAHALGTKMPGASPQGDRRVALADWMTDKSNPFFARNLANRTWAHFLGRGLVEPVDDVRDTNPPTNPELLDALAKHLVESEFDFKQLVRTITASRTYQLSSRPNAANERDEQNYSRALFKRPAAEVLLDMVCDVTGVPEKFSGVPAGARAIQLWDSRVRHDFLKLFGRPARTTACECERVGEPTVAQVLHVLNSPEMQARLSHDGGRLVRVERDFRDDGRLAEELYLTFFSRRPTARECETAVRHLGKEPSRRREAVEDLAWSLMNSLEFVFNH
jgi:hypothetical protein